MKTNPLSPWSARIALAAAAVFVGVSSAHADTRVGVGISIGGGHHSPPPPPPRDYVEVRVGPERYYYHRGTYYRPGPRGYVVVRAPRGAIVRTLPPSYVRIHYGPRVYYRYQDVYYVEAPGGGYEVVDAPAVVPDTPPPPPPVIEAEQSVWAGKQEYSYRDGQFFKKTEDGLIWVEAPVGAITKTLPNDAKSVWYKGTEYFEVDEVYFRKQPAGYEVVTAPWKN